MEPSFNHNSSYDRLALEDFHEDKVVEDSSSALPRLWRANSLETLLQALFESGIANSRVIGPSAITREKARQLSEALFLLQKAYGTAFRELGEKLASILQEQSPHTLEEMKAILTVFCEVFSPHVESPPSENQKAIHDLFPLHLGMLQVKKELEMAWALFYSFPEHFREEVEGPEVLISWYQRKSEQGLEMLAEKAYAWKKIYRSIARRETEWTPRQKLALIAASFGWEGDQEGSQVLREEGEALYFSPHTLHVLEE